MKSWKTLDRSVILEHSKYLQVETHTVELPDGRVITDWPWLVMPDYVNILAFTEDQRFLCFHQPKYGPGGLTLAVPGGYIEPGEDPLLAAQRELLEETGYTAEQWVNLGHYIVDGNRGAGTAFLFLAIKARRVAEANADDLEEQELRHLDQAEIEDALRSQQFRVIAWATTVALGLLELKKQNEI